MKRCNFFRNIIFACLLPMLAWGSGSKEKIGAVDILVSDHGLPKENFKFSIDNRVFKTDENGFFSQKLKEGEHRVVVSEEKGAKPISFKIVSGERTQLILNLFEENSEVDLNQPEKEKKLKVSKGAVGQITGQIFSVTDGSPIAGVKIYAKGVGAQSSTNARGEFEIELPEGEHTLSLTHRKFSTEILNRVKVIKGQKDRRTLQMTPTGLVLEDFVVLAPKVNGSIEALIEVRRKASDVADVMSAEQMAKSGDSDAAGSLRRVTGLTLKDGKYVYVRGLGERYSSTLLNGVSLPSPDPTRRVVPLDLFPVKFLNSMVIQKSYSAERPGEFGGGSVMLQTKKIPKKFFFKASLSQSLNSRIDKRMVVAGGSQDLFGIDDGGRAMPETLQKKGGDNNAFLSRNRHRVTEESGQDTLPELSLSTGWGMKRKNLRWGYNVSALYGDRFNVDRKDRIRYRENADRELEVDEQGVREKSERETMLGGIASINSKFFKKHSLNTHFILLRNTTNYVAQQNGVDFEGQALRETEREWAERELKTILVESENRLSFLGNAKLKSHYAISQAQRYEPDRVSDTYVKTSKGYKYKGLLDKDTSAYERRFFNLKDSAQDVGFSATTAFPWFYKRRGELTLGTSFVVKDRDSSIRRFAVNPDSGAIAGQSQVNGSEDLDYIFENCEDCFSYAETTRGDDSYRADQNIEAYYFKTKWPLARSLDVTAGARFERSRQYVESVASFQGLDSTTLTTRDWLPGGGVTWRFHPKMQLRLAYSETVSRPDFKEISNTTWKDFERGFEVTGNSSLQATVINSYDLRWEWYFARKGNFSLSFFYKDFEKPVEQIFIPASELRTTYINAQGATNYGAEVEFMLPFQGWFKNFSLGGNYSYINSEISIENATQALTRSTRRPLQGQSDYTANILLDYEKESWGLNASLAYNVIGPRIALIGPDELPDVVEQPMNQLDFVLSQKFGKSAKLGARIRNILDAEYRFTQGGKDWEKGRRGQAFSLSLSMEI